MGRGRKKLAPEVHKANGSYKKDPARENKASLKSDGKIPTMPPSLKGLKFAREKWNQLTKQLKEAGVIGSTDVHLIENYCIAYEGFRKGIEGYKKTGLVVEVVDRLGNLTYKKNQHVAEIQANQDKMLKMLPEMGLTPASRSKVSADVKDEDNSFTEWLRKTKENQN